MEWINSVSVLGNELNVYTSKNNASYGKPIHENAKLPNGMVNAFKTEEECQKYIDENYTQQEIKDLEIRVRVWGSMSVKDFIGK